jgi:hypothetical protein
MKLLAQRDDPRLAASEKKRLRWSGFPQIRLPHTSATANE